VTGAGTGTGAGAGTGGKAGAGTTPLKDKLIFISQFNNQTK